MSIQVYHFIINIGIDNSMYSATLNPNAATSNKEKIQLLKDRLKNLDAVVPPQKYTVPQSSFIRSRPNEDTSLQSNPHNTSNSYPSQTYLPLELKYMEVQQKYIQRSEQQIRVLSHLEDEVQSLQEEARLIKKSIDRTLQRGEENMGVLDREMGESVQELIQQLRSIKKELIDQIEQKYRLIKSETMAVAGSQFQSQWEESREQIVKGITNVKAKMQIDEAERDERVSFMVTGFGDEILKLQQQVQRQKQQRIENHRKLLSSVQLMSEEITNKVMQEKRECAGKQAQLEDYLQELCFKIETHLLR